MATTSGAKFSAKGRAYSAESATRALVTPAADAAALAASATPEPATSTSISAPILAAAPSVVSVAFFTAPVDGSATTRMLMDMLSLDEMGFVTKLCHQFLNRGDSDAALALWRFNDLQRRQARRNIYAQRVRRHRLDRFLLRLHDVGERRIARLIQAQIRGHHRRQLQFYRFQAAVDLPDHGEFAIRQHDLVGEGALAPAQQRRQRLAGLVTVVVNGLLAEDH